MIPKRLFKQRDRDLLKGSYLTGQELPDRVDTVFETVGEAAWDHSLNSVRRGGVIVVAGRTSGANPRANIPLIVRPQITIVGSVLGTLDEMRDLINFAAIAGIEPEIGQVLPMEKAADGFRAMWEGGTSGKIVFTRPNHHPQA